ncbi:hypothetical protein GCM10027446_18260 [Angustibacter peucedani]
MNVSTEQPLSDLRAERRRLSERVARLSWLRRLVAARSDLEVARLTGVPSSADDLEPAVRAALALEGPRGPELLHALSETSRRLDDESTRTQEHLDALTGELVERLAQDPGSCLAG